MSHFTQIKTSIQDLSILRCVLTKLDISWEKGSTAIKGYKNEISEAELVIEQANSIDIGFIFNDHFYELIADKSFWYQSWPMELFLKKINQSYAIHVLNQQLKNLGFSTVNYIKSEQGVIDIIAEKCIV